MNERGSGMKAERIREDDLRTPADARRERSMLCDVERFACGAVHAWRFKMNAKYAAQTRA